MKILGAAGEHMSCMYLDIGAGNPCAAHASARESPSKPRYLLRPSPVPFGAVRPDGSENKTIDDLFLPVNEYHRKPTTMIHDRFPIVGESNCEFLGAEKLLKNDQEK